MIYLAVDSCCHGCKYFKVEDIVNVSGDHVLMCALRQKCWKKRQSYLTNCNGGDIGVDRGAGVECDICKNGFTGLGDR